MVYQATTNAKGRPVFPSLPTRTARHTHTLSVPRFLLPSRNQASPSAPRSHPPCSAPSGQARAPRAMQEHDVCTHTSERCLEALPVAALRCRAYPPPCPRPRPRTDPTRCDLKESIPVDQGPLLSPFRRQQARVQCDILSQGARLLLVPSKVHRLVLGFLLPICQPHERRTLTTLGVTAAVSGTRMKMKLLWMA